MGDWEDDDWDAAADNFKPVAAAPAAGFETKGEAVLASVVLPDADRFKDEDEEVEEEEPKHESTVKTQPRKKPEKKWQKEEAQEMEQPLDDPIAEKMRQQRLVEQADLEAAAELFGKTSASGINIKTFLPKTVKDCEDYATEIVERFVLPQKDVKNFKVLVKALVRKACEPLSSAETKEVESAVGLVRAEKTKTEQAAKQKTTQKKSLNLGKFSAGLDDYQYEDAGDADDDFM